MINKKELLEELEKSFAEAKKELKFKTSFEEFEENFFIKDMVLHDGFVSTRLSRQLCRRIIDAYNSWLWYLHGIVMPNPSSMFSVTESQMFEDSEKDEIMKLMDKTSAIASRNSLIGLLKDKEFEAKFIDESVSFWKKEFIPALTKIVQKATDQWAQKASQL